MTRPLSDVVTPYHSPSRASESQFVLSLHLSPLVARYKAVRAARSDAAPLLSMTGVGVLVGSAVAAGVGAGVAVAKGAGVAVGVVAGRGRAVAVGVAVAAAGVDGMGVGAAAAGLGTGVAGRD